MEPTKAVEVLTYLTDPEDYYMTPEEKEAIRLGIEALQRGETER